MKKSLLTTKANSRRLAIKGKGVWLLFFTFLVLLSWFLPTMLFQVSTFVLAPVAKVSNWIDTSNEVFPSYLRSKSEMAKEIEDLKKKQSTEASTKLTVERLVEENSRLRNLLGVEKSEERIVAGVVAQSPNLIYDTLQIDKGLKQGVVVGAPVYSGFDNVIGIISRVANNFSFVELFTSPDFETNAFILDINVFSKMTGEGGGVAKIHLPQGVDLKKGQIVLLPGLAGGVYGEVAWVDSSPTQPEQFGFVVPALAINNLAFVSVGKKALRTRDQDEIEYVISEEFKKDLLLKDDILGEFKEKEIATSSENENEKEKEEVNEVEEESVDF